MRAGFRLEVARPGCFHQAPRVRRTEVSLHARWAHGANMRRVGQLPCGESGTGETAAQSFAHVGRRLPAASGEPTGPALGRRDLYGYRRGARLRSDECALDRRRGNGGVRIPRRCGSGCRRCGARHCLGAAVGSLPGICRQAHAGHAGRRAAQVAKPLRLDLVPRVWGCWALPST